MKELPDNEFDKIFQKRVLDYEPLFEEEAWELMDKKLRRRSRMVFFRNTSMLLTVLLLAGGIYVYRYADEMVKPAKKENSLQRYSRQEKKEIHSEALKPVWAGKTTARTTTPQHALLHTKDIKASRLIAVEFAALAREKIIEPVSEIKALTSSETVLNLPSVSAIEEVLSGFTAAEAIAKDTAAENIKHAKRIKLSLAFAIGPDFNSVNSLAGNQPTLNAGVLVHTAFSNRISISTGLRFGPKNYHAPSYDYSQLKPALKNAMAGVDGFCNVLEIPLRASYTVINNRNKSISVNGGLSSYLMLKEKYIFNYTAESGYKDYVLEKTNANQHYFSVAELSATYRIKPGKSRINLGIEPYVKLPLSGLGEGNVHLKSSGITVNLFYELSGKTK